MNFSSLRQMSRRSRELDKEGKMTTREIDVKRKRRRKERERERDMEERGGQKMTAVAGQNITTMGGNV